MWCCVCVFVTLTVRPTTKDFSAHKTLCPNFAYFRICGIIEWQSLVFEKCSICENVNYTNKLKYSFVVE